MAKILYETLLLFLRGRVRHRRCDRGRKRVRLGGGLAAGGKVPPGLRTGGARPGGRSLTILA